MSFRLISRPLVVATALAGGLALVAPGTAGAHESNKGHEEIGLDVQQVNLVSDIAGMAPLTDPDLVNPWGVSFGPATPIWVSNQGTSTSTLYTSAAGSTVAVRVPTVRVGVPFPTGQVFNGVPTSFLLSNGITPARFLFATLTGQIFGWAPPVTPLIGLAEAKASVPGAAYTGLAIATAQNGDQLYAANFAQGRVDVFDSRFNLVDQPKGAFRDSHVPKGFSPFNVQTLNGKVFVAYAKADPETGRSVAGPGLGFVDEFTVDGEFVSHIASRGTLNAPWGLEIAPSSWGELAGSLLIGNFGDGRVNVVSPKSNGRFDHKIAAQLENTDGHPLEIPGLWALRQGTATTGGTDSVWFTAGIADETHGLLGVLRRP